MMRERGFTLLEVVIAVAVLGLALTILLGNQMQSSRLAYKARAISDAYLFAEARLAELETMPFPEAAEVTGPLDEKGVLSFSETIRETENEHLRKVEILVFPVEGRREIYGRFETYIADPGKEEEEGDGEAEDEE